ncbi:MAG: hypothetical protein H6715_05425 [Myxococcales bacterium]|nr:hypothetical protein [Myxococcales bacterium]MCB9709424.1 hypothetical protein [Myxococcales bacterium]
MRVIGVDENGLGPRLGPLVASLVAIDIRVYQPQRLFRLGRALGIDDSKRVASFGHMAHVEGLALAMLEALSGEVPKTSDDLIRLVSLEPIEHLQAPCPRASFTQCWHTDDKVFLPAFGGHTDEGRAIVRALSQAGVMLRSWRSAIACAGVLNGEAKRGRNRLQVNLGLFERLVRHARKESASDIQAICGMVGGIRSYADYVEFFAKEDLCPLPTGAGTRRYRIEGFGELRFAVGADGHHLPVALASMVGKYVRELCMLRAHHFYARGDRELQKVSGYHDPLTARFVRRTAKLRRQLGIAPECFER